MQVGTSAGNGTAVGDAPGTDSPRERREPRAEGVPVKGGAVKLGIAGMRVSGDEDGCRDSGGTVGRDEWCPPREGNDDGTLRVRTGGEEARGMVCVLLLPGRALKTAAGARSPAPLETPGTGRARAGRMPAELERTGRTWRQDPGRLETDGVSDGRRVRRPTRPKAHLTSGISGERSESAACRG